MKNEHVFFLGGYDLEMVTIKKILEEKNEKYFDKKLSWGAKASAYKEELEKILTHQIPVLIELELDIELPTENIIIDHHNERSGADKKTSIEQVAELLNIELSREQKLIAENDRAYIDGLLEMNATEEEINKITEEDIKAQGVTEEDKKYAKISVDHFLTKLDEDTVLIHSLTEQTSAVTKLVCMYYRHIFIITPEKKFIYSGTGQVIEKLKEKYSELKRNNPKINYWYGGNLPDKGYFGANEPLKKKEIEELCNLMPEKRIHSQHIFMFPFTIEEKEIKESNSSKERLKKIHERLEKSSWEYKAFQMSLIPEEIKKTHEKRTTPYSADEIWAYNEYNYFYDCVRDTLFNMTSKEKLFDEREKVPVSLYYEMKTNPNDEMFIYIKGKPEPYRLSINHLSLRIFETGIGILSITLYNYCKTDFNDILIINDFARRIYPQFLGEQTEESEPTDATKYSFLADKISFTIDGRSIEEYFRTEDFFNVRHKFASYLEYLLKPLHSSESGYQVVPVIDDRMYTICWYENDALINNLKNSKDNSYVYESSDDWYKYIFLDNGEYPLVSHKDLKKELIQKSTYPRFTEKDVLYGVTRYSMMCLCSADWFPYNIIRNHLQKMYYQMCVLLLAQRASILSFNNELGNITLEISDVLNLADHQKLDRKLKELECLNVRVLNFQNRLVFDEITPQEQGIELYEMALKNMNTLRMLENLTNKIKQTHDYIDLKTERSREESDRSTEKSIAVLTSIGAIFFPLTFIAAIWAMEVHFMKYLFIGEKSYLLNDPFSQTIRNNLPFINLGEFILISIVVLLMTHNIMKKLHEKDINILKQPFKSLKNLLRTSLDWRVIVLLALLLVHLIFFF